MQLNEFQISMKWKICATVQKRMTNSIKTMYRSVRSECSFCINVHDITLNIPDRKWEAANKRHPDNKFFSRKATWCLCQCIWLVPSTKFCMKVMETRNNERNLSSEMTHSHTRQTKDLFQWCLFAGKIRQFFFWTQTLKTTIILMSQTHIALIRPIIPKELRIVNLFSC